MSCAHDCTNAHGTLWCQVLSAADDDRQKGEHGEAVPEQPGSAEALQDAAAAALSAAAAKAKSMVDAEERDIQRTMSEVTSAVAPRSCHGT